MRAGTAIAVVAAVLVLGAAAARPVSPQPAGLRVGLVLTGGIDDPLEGMAYRALLRATRELGVQGRVLVAGPREGSEPSLAYFARRGYDLVITFGALTLDDVQAVASRYPRVKFLMLDASIRELRSSATNVRGTVFRVEEGGYLAGYLAGLVERRRPGPDAVSTIGGVKAEQVDRFIAGFRAGAREADPGIRAFNAYSGDFTVPSRCRHVALRQIARGSGVVFPVAGACGLGALGAARDKRVFGVGVDVDQSALGPHILTSVVKRFDLATYRAVAALVHGRFRTGVDAVHGLRDGGVSLGKISPRVPRPLVAELERARRLIVTGEVAVPTSVAS